MNTNTAAAKSNKPAPWINSMGDKVWRMVGKREGGESVVEFADRTGSGGRFSVLETFYSERSGSWSQVALLTSSRDEARKIWADRKARGWILIPAD